MLRQVPSLRQRPSPATPGGLPGLLFKGVGLILLAFASGMGAETARRIVPLSEYVRIGPVVGGNTENGALSLPKEALNRLVLYFERDSLLQDDGIQFVRITVVVTKPNGGVHEKVVEKAFTFARSLGPEGDEERMRIYAQAITPLGFANRRKVDSVDIGLEDVPDWAQVEVRVDPDEDYAAYSTHRGNRLVWHYRARDGRLDGAFYLGLPKVVYDSRPQGDLEYGRTSAMYRIFWLDGRTGARFPVNLGMGVFGVRTPIDVSSAGGGFALSLLLDLFEVARHAGLDLTSKVNAGVEAVPFFPLDHPPRLLVALRVGIAP